MAVKKTTKKKEVSAAPTKAEAKETAPKKTPKTKAAAPVAVAPVAEPAKAAKPKAAAPKKAAPKKAAAPIKLTASQSELLKKIHAAAEKGYTTDKKVEHRTIASLLEKKLVKKGAKDKATGLLAFHLSNGGKQYSDKNITF